MGVRLGMVPAGGCVAHRENFRHRFSSSPSPGGGADPGIVPDSCDLQRRAQRAVLPHAGIHPRERLSGLDRTGRGFWSAHLRCNGVHDTDGALGGPHWQASDTDCNDDPVDHQLPCNRPPDAAGAGVCRALCCGRGISGDSESARRCVRPTDRPTGKCEHRIGNSDGLGVVSRQYSAQHCRRTIPVPGSQRFAGFNVAWLCQCRDGIAEFPAA